MPKVSVIIPVYNVEKYLGECLDSILGQTLKNIEVICVDDGSTDRSAAILEDYASKDSRVLTFKQANAGAFRAREVGVKASKGEFLYFMDADDLLEPCAFEELCGLAERENLDQVIFASSVFCEADISAETAKWAKTLFGYYSVPSALCGKVMPGMDLMSAMVRMDKFHVSPPLRIIRASVIKDNRYGFPDARSRADNYFTPISLYYSRRAVAVGDRYYRRRVREDSITTAPGAAGRHFRNLLFVMAALCEFEPFEKEILDPKSALSRFVGKLAFTASKSWAWKLSGADRLRILDEALSAASPRTRALMANVIFLAARGLGRRPGRSVKSALKFAVKQVVRRLLRREEEDWWL